MEKRLPSSRIALASGISGHAQPMAQIVISLLLYMEQRDEHDGRLTDATSPSNFIPKSKARSTLSKYLVALLGSCQPFPARIIFLPVGRAMANGFTSLPNVAVNPFSFGRCTFKSD